MTLEQPVRFGPAVENIQPDETETIEGLIATFDTILKTTAKDCGHAVRAVPDKAHGAAFADEHLPREQVTAPTCSASTS